MNVKPKNLDNIENDYPQSETSSDDDIIINNDDCHPNEDEINKSLELYRLSLLNRSKETSQNTLKDNYRIQTKQINFTIATKDNELIIDKPLQLPKKVLLISNIINTDPAIKTLITSQCQNNQLDLIPSIATLIQQIEYYKDYDRTKMIEEIKSYINNKRTTKQLEGMIKQKTETSDNDDYMNYPLSIECGKKLSKIPEEKEQDHIEFDSIEQVDKTYITPPKSKEKCLTLSISEQNISSLQKELKFGSPNSLQGRTIKDNNCKGQKTTTCLFKHGKSYRIKNPNTSNMILFNKYNDQFREIANTLTKKGLINKNNDYISLNTLKMILNYEHLGFLSNKNSLTTVNNSEEFQLVYKIFALMNIGDKISLHNFFIFSLSILDIAECYMGESISELNTHQNSAASSPVHFKENKIINQLYSTQYFTVDNNNVIDISKEQSKKIFREFQIFNKNWKFSLREKNKQNHFQEIFEHNLTMSSSFANQHFFDSSGFKSNNTNNNNYHRESTSHSQTQSNISSKLKPSHLKYTSSINSKDKDNTKIKAIQRNLKHNQTVKDFTFGKKQNSKESNEHNKKKHMKKIHSLKSFNKSLQSNSGIKIYFNGQCKEIVVNKYDKPEDVCHKFLEDNNIKDYKSSILLKRMIFEEMDKLKM